MDWGNEEDEQQTGYLQNDGREDAEDAVSLGGDEDDDQDLSVFQQHSVAELDATLPASPPQQSQTEPPSSQTSRHDPDLSQSSLTPDSPQHSKRSQTSSFAQLKHALPPKPVLASADYARAAPPQTSTLAGPMVQRDRRSNGHGSHDQTDSLPPDWETRVSKTGGGEYFYNNKTHESTWARPVAASGHSSPAKDRETSAAQSPPPSVNDRSQTSDRNERNPAARGRKQRRRSSPGTMTFDDRHYRPGEPTSSAPSADDRGAPRPRVRQSSPDVVADRRPRSLTPPRRDTDRNARRPNSRSPSPVGRNTWRDAQRDVQPSRLSPPPERGWARGQNSVSLEGTRSPSPDNRAQRNRRPPNDVSPPRHLSHTQDQNDRRIDPREWSSTHSTLSASYTPTSRIRRLYSSRGGGCLRGRLKKPRELRYIGMLPFLRLCHLLET